MSDNQSSNTVIEVSERHEFGKGASRRARAEHKIPAVLYGHGTEPKHLLMPGHKTMLAVKQSNAILTLKMDGMDQLALVKEVQRHAIKPLIHHIDLIVVKRGEKVLVDVAVHTVGDSAPESVVMLEGTTVHVSAEATHIPESIEVDVTGLEAGTLITAGDLKLPSGVELAVEPDTLIVNITSPAVANLGESTDGAEGDADAAAAE